jgi:hypothetical protein
MRVREFAIAYIGASRDIGGDARFALVMNNDSPSMNDKHGCRLSD